MKLLKISGLMVDSSVENPSDLKYPKVGPSSAKIIECLEAEPAGVEEVVSYIGISENKTRSLLRWLRDRGIVRHNKEMKYELVDLIGASLAYHKEK